jgi:N-acetylmuramoyl-L-alanine amidase
MRLSGGLVAGVLVGALVAPATPLDAAGAATKEPRVPLRTVASNGARDGAVALPAGRSRWRVPAHSLVAVTWQGATAPSVRLRVPGEGGAWERLDPLADLGEEGSVRGTDPRWVGAGTTVALRVSGAASSVRLVVIDPGADPEQPATRLPTADEPSAPLLRKRPKQAPMPRIRSRKRWGANERWRSSAPRYNRTLKQVHIHHTAGTNSYRRRDVPGILRAIYRYHTRTMGWSDVGYNFFVDKWGRAWVGRAGGARRLVRGAHTLGFNRSSTGVAVLGNFEDRKPRAEVITMLVRLSAWKLDPYDRDARGRIRVVSQGSDLYPEGERVRLPVIDGHRDTNATACPGQHLYDLLPRIRARTANRVDRFS